ncbi:MAG: histidine ammonia-lyase [bacterium]
MNTKFQISPNTKLDFTTIKSLIFNDTKLELSTESKELIVNCKLYFDKKIAESTSPLYGINTGFGSLCNIKISDEELSKLQENLIKSHSCSLGAKISDEIVKIMMLLKINALSLGKSGVQLSTVERLVDFYNHDIIPIVYELGSLGASGDLAPLAKMCLPLLGLSEVMYEGKERSAKDILELYGWEPITLGAKEGLALLNGTQFMSAHAVWSIIKADKAQVLSDIIAAISLDAYNCLLDPFIAQISEIRPHPGQIETAANIRKLLSGSEIAASAKAHVQDPYSFRCIPQVHGACKDSLNYIKSVILTEINSVTDNPTVFPEDDLIVSGGNFHGEPIAQVMDFFAIAMSEIGAISERRTYRLIAGQRGLPEFLVSAPGLNSGFMIPQYAAAAIASQNKQLSTPASVDSIPSSNEQEDHVSMGANAATKALRVIDNVIRILAIELYNACQAIQFRDKKTSPYLQDIIENYRKSVKFVEEDVVMHDDLEKTIGFIETNEFVLP